MNNMVTTPSYEEWRLHVMIYACEWCDLAQPPICNARGKLCSAMARHVDLQSRIKCRRLCKEFQLYSTTTPLETYIIQLASCAQYTKFTFCQSLWLGLAITACIPRLVLLECLCIVVVFPMHVGMSTARFSTLHSLSSMYMLRNERETSVSSILLSRHHYIPLQNVGTSMWEPV